MAHSRITALLSGAEDVCTLICIAVLFIDIARKMRRLYPLITSNVVLSYGDEKLLNIEVNYVCVTAPAVFCIALAGVYPFIKPLDYLAFAVIAAALLRYRADLKLYKMREYPS